MAALVVARVEAEAAVVRDGQAAVDAENETMAAPVAAGVEAEAAVVRGEQAAVDAENETEAALVAAGVGAEAAVVRDEQSAAANAEKETIAAPLQWLQKLRQRQQ